MLILVPIKLKFIYQYKRGVRLGPKKEIWRASAPGELLAFRIKLCSLYFRRIKA